MASKSTREPRSSRERNMDSRIVGRDPGSVLVGRFRVGQFGRLHVGIAFRKVILGGLVMASRSHQDHCASRDYRSGPGR